MNHPTDQSPRRQTVDALIAEAIGAPRALVRSDRFAELNRELRAAIGDLYLAAEEQLPKHPEYSRDWWRIRKILDAANEALRGDLGSGYMSAALQLAELGRQARALADCVGEPSHPAATSRRPGQEGR